MSSTLQNPVHTYFTIGTYTVTLTVDGMSGSNVETQPGFIRMREGAFYYIYLPLTRKAMLARW